MSKVRVRFAPSPTGVPHIGNTRTALFNFLFARHFGGKFVLRIEDTDRERLVPESLPKIMEILKWLGLEWDEGPGAGGKFGPYTQSERLEIYKKHAGELVEKGSAYRCFCTKERLEEMRAKQKGKKAVPRYDRTCLKLSKEEVGEKLKKGEKFVIRLKVPGTGGTSWKDLIQGEIKIANSEVDDQVLLKSDGFPTYHLAVVVDDHLMEISHILRAVEWISSTPKHLLLYQAFGWEPPEIGHFPLILGPDKGKLSKRHGAKSALDYQDDGYLPEGLLNFMLLLGWAPKDDKELFSLEEMIKAFDLAGIQKANAIFNVEKLNWFNGVWIRKAKDEDLVRLLCGSDGGRQFVPKGAIGGENKAEGKGGNEGESKGGSKRGSKGGDKGVNKGASKGVSVGLVKQTIPLVKERMVTLADYSKLTAFFFSEPEVKVEMFDKDTKNKLGETREHLEEAKVVLESVKEWNKEEIEEGLRALVGKKGWEMGAFFMNFRIAMTGEKFTPPITDSIVILGRETTIERLEKILKKL